MKSLLIIVVLAGLIINLLCLLVSFQYQISGLTEGWAAASIMSFCLLLNLVLNKE